MEYDKKAIFPAYAQPSSLYSVVAVIDIVDSCILHCPECPRGSRTMKNSFNKMSIDLYTDICKKLTTEGINKVLLFNWSEPFLHPNIDLFIKISKKFNFIISLSSNLSLPSIATLIPSFTSGLDNLRVSVSGYTQKIHEIYHRGSHIEVVREHLQSIATHNFSPRVDIAFLDFGYNSAEAPLWEKEAKELGMGFIHEQASGDPLGEDRKQVYYTTIKSFSSIIKEGTKEHIDYLPINQLTAKKKMCSLATMPVIDCYGKAYLCCDRPSTPIFCLGDYLDLPYERMLALAYLHPECSNCSAERTNTLSEDQCKAISHVIFNE